MNKVKDKYYIIVYEVGSKFSFIKEILFILIIIVKN